MGLTHVNVRVGNPANGRESAEVQCLVDSGAVHSLIPGRILRRLHIKPHSSREFVLADGPATQALSLIRVSRPANYKQGDCRQTADVQEVLVH